MKTWKEDNMLGRFTEGLKGRYYYNTYRRQDDDSWKEFKTYIDEKVVTLYVAKGLDSVFTDKLLDGSVNLRTGSSSIYVENNIVTKISSKKDESLLSIDSVDDLYDYCEDNFDKLFGTDSDKGSLHKGEKEIHNPSGLSGEILRGKLNADDAEGKDEHYIETSHQSVYVYRVYRGDYPGEKNSDIVIAEIVSANEEE